MMPRSDLEYWNRRENAGAIFANLRWTWSHIRAHAGPAALWLILIHILLGIQPALLIHVTRHLVDAVVDAAGGGPSGFDDILPLLIAFGLIQLATSDVLWHVRDVFQLRLEQNLSHVLGCRLLERSSRLPLLFFDVSETYDRFARAHDPGRKLGRLFLTALRFLQAVITAVSVAAMFAPVSVWISVAMLGALAPLVGLAIRQSRMFMAFTYGETPEERRAGYVNRILTGRSEQKEMRLFGLHAPLTGRWRRMRQVLRERLLDQRQRQVIVSIPATGLQVAVSVSVTVILAYLLADRILTPGRFVALFQGVGDMLRAGGSLGFSSRSLQTGSAEVGYVRDFFELHAADGPGTPPTGQSPGQKLNPFPRPLDKGLFVDNVHFAYPATASGEATPPVLQGVSFHLAPGERVALVGDNGAGKSTLARILLGLYPPTAGRVAADGLDYAEIDPASTGDAVSAAFQDFSRFEFTLGQSIGIGTSGGSGKAADGGLLPSWLQPDMDVVAGAAVRAGADELAKRLPKGYDTPVGHVLDGGQGLSGGEWQRIAIARAFTREPELLILDEPAAALDAVAEAALYRQFAELLEGRTALLISHRLGSARMADRILVLRQGRIVEEGRHDNLLAYGGVYAGMWEEQASWYR
ncbi:MAG: ABC transporter ATP-binding protein [Gemmatimonadota bacterium]|nr:ABC transporter ATP-binding protein [Gemmatimonadota bacterium]